MTQIEQITANAAATIDPDGGNSSRLPWTPTDARGLSGVDPQVIMQRVAEGELLRDIAKDYGVSRSAVSHHIAKHVPADGWKQVREASIAARLEQSCEAMEVAHDALTLARARESARLWMWRAERELPHLYGQRTQVTHEVGPDLGDLLRTAKQRVSQAGHTAAPQLTSDDAHNRTIIATPDEYAKE